MKKFLIAAITAILLLFLFDMAYYRWGVYIDLNKDQEVSFLRLRREKKSWLIREREWSPLKSGALTWE